MIVQDAGWKCVSWIVAVLAILTSPSMSAVVPDPIDDGVTIWGDWQLTLEADGRTSPAILSFSEDDAGTPVGQWIDASGVRDLADLEYAAFQLTFKRLGPGDPSVISSFSGTAEKLTITGVLSTGPIQTKVSGKWIRPLPRIVGTWEGKTKTRDRESPACLVLSVDPAGDLIAEWKAASGEYSISDIVFISPKLAFKRTAKLPDRQVESLFQGFIKGDTLSGTFTDNMGASSFQAQHRGASAIGKWLLRYSDSGPRSQIMIVHPDLTCRLGPSPAESVVLDGDKIRFRAVAEFGGQTGPVDFNGRFDGKKLSGERTGAGRTQKVDGSKIPTPPRKNWAPLTRDAPRRQPGVSYVPTPQPVIDKMLEMAAVTKDDLVYDLGCGDARILVTAALRYGCRGAGYDISPDRIRESRVNIDKNKLDHLLTVEEKDIYDLDISKATVITLYLLPQMNAKLIPQLETLKPGSRIVSHNFDVPGVKPDAVVQVGLGKGIADHTVYLFTTPLKKIPPDSTGALAPEDKE